MTRLHRFWVRNTHCRFITPRHERDWHHDRPDRCRHCEARMELDPTRSYVGLTNPSSGD